MAVELVASALLTAVFDKLFERLTSTEFKNFFRGKKLVAEQLNALQKKLDNVSLLLDDAEDRQLDEPNVKKWLDDLKDIIFKVDDLVEEINSELRSYKEIEQQPGCCVCARMKSILTQFDKTVRDEMKKYSEGLDDLLSRVKNLHLRDGVPRKTGSSVQKSLFVPLREERSVFGRDSDKEKIVKLLLSSDDDRERIGVLPIVGMGGLGKTTLAQLAYDDERVNKDRFELRAWVTVSTEFDVSRIIKSLLQQIGRGSQTEEPAVLQRQLKEALSGKKFLFVLDDVWDENYDNWDLLMSNFLSGDLRSKIIVTTRSRGVCSNVKTGTIHELESVPVNDCWKIFSHHAFGGESNLYPELEKTGREIVKNCKGLPLAVKSVGGLLRSERDSMKWESILRSRVWSRNNKNGVLPSLWLSYCCLPSPLKQCFAYCAIFPQDYVFKKERMVLLWMAEGFLQPDPKEKSLEEVGDEYFEVLVSRSFFQKDYMSTYVMHDLVHDLATFVSGEFCLNLGRGKKMGNTSSKTRYLYCDAELQSDSVKVLGEATYLRTYIDESDTWSNWSTTNSLVKEILDEGRFLRVLSVREQKISELLNSPKNHMKHLRYLNLSYSRIEEVPVSVCTLYSLQTLDLSYCKKLSKLPTNIGNLTNLRYLNLPGSDIEEVPNSVCTLYSLQTLVLSNCERLSKLPTDIGNLTNLHHLSITDSDGIKKMPPRMGNLKELRTLSDFVVGEADGCSSIKELGKLRHLAGRLRVRRLQNVETVDDARKANFRDKGNLVRLVLEWDGEEATGMGSEMEVLDALLPHTNLEKLFIYGYPASKFPNWVGDSSFSKMVYVNLSGGSHDSCRLLPPLGQLPSLKELVIKSFHGVESIGCEFYGGNGISSFTPFPCLEYLTFFDMKRWKEWSFVGRDGEEISGCFPRLVRLSFEKCPNLGAGSLLDCETLEALEIRYSFNSMECFPLDKFLRLKRLILKECPKLKSLSSSIGADRRLTSLVILDCPEIESFQDRGLPLSLESLEIDNCGKLVAQNMHWDLQRLTSLTSLTIYGGNLDSFPQGLLPASLTSFTLWGFQNLKSLNGTAFQPIKSLQRLEIWSCKELESLPEQVLPNSLCYLDIKQCPLLERRYRKQKGDDWRYISRIPKIDIDGETTREQEKRERQNSASTNA